MLVITRRKEEEIVIGDNVRVKIVAIRGEKVRLGVIAPREVPVNRSEIHDAIHNQIPSGKVFEDEPGT